MASKSLFQTNERSVSPDSDHDSNKATDEADFADRGTTEFVSELQLNEGELENRLNDILAEAISQGLSHFGGDNVVESLLYILELDHSVDLRNVVEHLDELEKGLDKMFGSAAYVVLGHICADLARKLGLDPRGRTLAELVIEARTKIGAKQ